jgi:hypothetical protein
LVQVKGGGDGDGFSGLEEEVAALEEKRRVLRVSKEVWRRRIADQLRMGEVRGCLD